MRKTVKAALAGGRAKVTAAEGDILEDMDPRSLSDAVMLASSLLFPSSDSQAWPPLPPSPSYPCPLLTAPSLIHFHGGDCPG